MRALEGSRPSSCNPGIRTTLRPLASDWNHANWSLILEKVGKKLSCAGCKQYQIPLKIKHETDKVYNITDSPFTIISKLNLSVFREHPESSLQLFAQNEKKRTDEF